MFPLKLALKFPVYFYGCVKFQSLKGKVIINGKIRSGMIGFGQSYEVFTKSKKNAEVLIDGEMIFSGSIQFGKDYFVYIAKNAKCEMGNMSSLGNSGKIICFKHIVFGDYCRIGFESQIIDTNSHQMINSLTGEKFDMIGKINLGNFNYFGNRITVLKDTKTPDYCTISSNTLCNGDYTNLEQNSLIGGVPAKLLRKNITRDWEGEMKGLNEMLTSNF